MKGMKTKRVHFQFNVWGYGDDVNAAWKDVLDTVSTWVPPHDHRVLISRDVIRCNECGGDNKDNFTNP